MKYLSVLKTSIVIPQTDSTWESEIPKDMKQRAPRIWRMARVAVDRLMKDSAVTARSIVSATALGALDETKTFLDGVYKDGFGSPKSFIASVHNSMAGKLAIDFAIPGPNLTICDCQNSFASALVAASLLEPENFPCILLAIDEKIELMNTLQPHWSETCNRFLDAEWQEAAVAFLLDIQPGNKTRLHANGPVACAGRTPELTLESLINKTVEPLTMLPLQKTTTSFVQPAIAVHSLIAANAPGYYSVGSFSPQAQAAAVVTVCI